MSAPARPEYEKYDSPAKLAADTHLSDAEKVRLLQQWHDDEEALLRASCEGLPSSGDYQLQDVLEALKKFKPNEDLNNNI